MDRSVSLVHVEGEGEWYRESEPHTPERMRELHRYAVAFDDGFYWGCRHAESFGFKLPYGSERYTAASYSDHRDFLLNYTNDLTLAARVALELVGPARSSAWG